MLMEVAQEPTSSSSWIVAWELSFYLVRILPELIILGGWDPPR